VRILVIAKDFPFPGQPVGGIVVLRQARALAELGHTIKVVRVVPRAPALTEKWRQYRAVPQRYEVEGIPVETIRAFFPPRMLAMEYLPLQVDRAIGRIVAAFRPDIVHAHCLIPSGQLAVRHGVPAVITAHGSDAYDWPWRRTGLLQAAKEGVRRADLVVAVSDFIRSTIRKLVPRDVRVVFNGADESVFAPRDASDARRELGIPADRFVIAFAGRPPEPKGAFDLLKAAALLADLRPLVLLAGPGDEERALSRFARELGIEARLCGLVSHECLAVLIAAADVFCLPSYREGLPLAVCEAMLSGRPVVATPVGGIPEIVSDGESGFLVRPGDSDALAARLRTIAGDGALASRMGAAARDFALTHLTWKANALSYDRLYREAIRPAV
jgi:glycosyltransferase involved in cell wall biosynthesis